MAVTLIDYGAGNLRSVEKALRAAGAPAVRVTGDAADLARASRIVLPGVGAFGACMAGLAALPGMVEALHDAVRRRALPFLGICVGMQLMAERGEEFGTHPGLGWVRGHVRRITPAGLKVPHMGWNQVQPRQNPCQYPSTLVQPGEAYFVHSFALMDADPGDIAATTGYGGPVIAAVQRDNMLGVQFHPEKSQGYGLALLGRFLEWQP